MSEVKSMRQTGAALMLGTLLLAGCSSSPAPDIAPPPPDFPPAPADTCGAQAVESLTGETLDDETRIWLEDRSGASTIRIVEPGQNYTTDYRAERLRVVVDEDDIITSIRCG
ncbi:I78 family peptidase inhibitor [Salinicola aestuarinus]|uniref:I78 family peptidase inhibitor n=1 Tax=Salinicola aestuarinus TaxID=1949082 RepID=UPI000DA26608|nr:I78 family peptidase inhibitor [Salinicola aestuarinus]